MTYLHLENVAFIEEKYQQYLKNPQSVESSWRFFFEGMQWGQKPTEQDFRLLCLFDAYRRYGHLQATFNSLQQSRPLIQELSLERWHFSHEDLKTFFPTLGILSEKRASLEKIVNALKQTYCQNIGIEYMDCRSLELREWIQKAVEKTRCQIDFPIEKKHKILHLLNKAELFEIFLHTKYVGQKRFSLEGAETLIPILDEIIEAGAAEGVDEFVLGMAHRGRLNVLANILKKSFSMIFSEFEDFIDPLQVQGSGDVKYHKGFSADISTLQKDRVHVSLTPNPSHLESVNPVVQGKVLAKQIYRTASSHQHVVPILIHGDASIAGQGVVYETLQLNAIAGYRVGGTIHIVINNQIGFTTLPEESRSTHYCTDIARSFSAPVFHVNAEDPEGCLYAAKLAMEIRQRFHCDVFIEINGYRKYGHNEGDEPFFTQPLLYQNIRKKESIRKIYQKHLLLQGIAKKELVESLEEEFQKELHYELEELKLKKEASKKSIEVEGVWKGFQKPTLEGVFQQISTTVDEGKLKELAQVCNHIPSSLHVHNKLKKLLQKRQEMLQQDPQQPSIDWAMGEQLAFATLLWEKKSVRLSGQDSQRGTFTQRHAVWVDQTSGEKYFPLCHLCEDQGHFSVYNSSLSEFSVLGFEFGYTLAYPSALVMWEAQFGDFANGAQIIIDQYLSCCEQKWNCYSGLVLLLPHGYEGQGAEHSSARLERFLQLSGKINMQITYPSTPAQYFHLLRRQVLRPFRLPLIVLTPKKLLRHPLCLSSLKDFSSQGFQEILDDPCTAKESIEHLLFCSGCLYYDLLEEREKRNLKKVAILRIEQLYPLHFQQLQEVIQRYPRSKQYVWAQEEPLNMGGYRYLYPLLQKLLPSAASLRVVGREESASPATGSHRKHEEEHQQLIESIFQGME